MSTAGPPTPEFLADAAFFIRLTQILFCSMYAVTIWDWFVSLNREYRYIWQQRWTPAKFLYLGCRYWVIMVMPVVLWINTNESHTVQDCKTLYNLPPLLCMWNQIFAASVLVLRTHAFMGRKKWFLATMLASLTAMAVYQLYVALKEMAPLPFVVAPFETGPCLPAVRTPGSAYVMGWFIAPLLFDTAVTSLTIWKALQIRQASQHAGSPLLQTFLREGINYFILISLANLVNGIFNIQPKESMSAIAVPLSLVLPDILACRLILDLREQADRPAQTPYSSSIPNISGISGNWTTRNRTKFAMVSSVTAMPSQIKPAETETTQFALDRSASGPNLKPATRSVDRTVGDHRRYAQAYNEALYIQSLPKSLNGVRVDVEQVQSLT